MKRNSKRNLGSVDGTVRIIMGLVLLLLRGLYNIGPGWALVL